MGFLIESFQVAGWSAFLGLLVCLLALPTAAAGVVGALVQRRWRLWGYLGSTALGLGALVATIGAAGTQRGLGVVNWVLESESVDPAQMERLGLEGYADAAMASWVGLALAALPMVLGATAAALSLLSRKSAGVDKAVAAVAGCVAGISVLLAAGSLYSARDDAARQAIRKTVVEAASQSLATTDMQSCRNLEKACGVLGAAQIERELPGAQAQAGRCVDYWLAGLEKAPAPARPAHAASDSDDRARFLAEAAEYGMEGLLKTDRKARLREILESPLLIDPVQRQRVQKLIEQQS